MQLAEKYYERFDTTSFLQLLPSTIGIGMLTNYFTLVLEAQNSHKRTLQVRLSRLFFCFFCFSFCCS
jgi:hypothetical protein